VITVDEVRQLARSLPRTTEHLIRDSVRFRIGSIVYLAFSPDEELMGFAFPKDERDDLIAGDPDTFLLPKQSDMRFNWVLAHRARLDRDEARELIVEAWRMCVPKKVSRAYDEQTAATRRRHSRKGAS
jgi:hypothetical protein